MKWVIFAICFVATAAVAYEFVPIQKTLWLGWDDLTIDVTSSAGPIKSLKCCAYLHRSYAEEFLNHPDRLPESDSTAVIDPFEGKLIAMHLKVTGVDSPLGREIHSTHPRFLVIVAKMQNGQVVTKMVDIPPHRESR